MPGHAYRSQLLPHLEMIRAARRRRRTWREITEELEKTAGITTSPSAVYEFFKRQVKGRRPLGFPEPEGASIPRAEAQRPSAPFSLEPAPAIRPVASPEPPPSLKTPKPRPQPPLTEKETPSIWG